MSISLEYPVIPTDLGATARRWPLLNRESESTLCNDQIHYGLQVVFVCLHITPSHYHHYADSSEGIGLIKRDLTLLLTHWTYVPVV